MTDLIRTLPVYRRVVQYAYAEHHDWSKAALPGARTYASNVIPRINLGPATGKTTVAIDVASMWSDVIVVTAQQSLASNIARRHPKVRVFGPDDLAKASPSQFHSTQPLFIFDGVPRDDTLDTLVKFRPERFVHFGLWA